MVSHYDNVGKFMREKSYMKKIHEREKSMREENHVEIARLLSN